MVLFFKTSTKSVIAVNADHAFSPEETKKLCWLFRDASVLDNTEVDGWFV